MKFFRKHRPEEVQACFIVSTGRTGTKFLAHALNEHVKEVLAFHEPFKETIDLSYRFFHTKEVNEISSFSTDFLRLRRKVLDKANRREKIYVESDGYNRLLIPVIKDCLPNAKILHIIRNPVDIVRSIASRGDVTSSGFLAKIMIDKNLEISPLEVPNDPFRKAWTSFDVVGRAAWLWYFYNNEILKEIEDYKYSLTIKFEDIFKEGVVDLNEITNFICHYGVASSNFERVQKNDTKQFQIGDYITWTEKQKADFHMIIDRLSDKFSYSPKL